MRPLKNTSLYIHIPFCDHKCIYCDFYSIITTENIPNFLSALKKEIEFYSAVYSENYIFTTIYFGGGTPSLMSIEYIEEIINYLYKHFKFTDDVEVTLETNPGTVDKEKLRLFRTIGINRLSIGIQSFDNADLKFLTRIHDKRTAVDTVLNAYSAGFENISIDLIFNLPQQTRKKWIKNLQAAVELPIKHVSAYSLILERGTILNKMVLDGKVKVQDEDYDADLYEITINYLSKRGFKQYEVSNFAQDGFECRHNNAYWRYGDYLGFGTSAHSFANGRRWWNFSSLKFYMDSISRNGNAEAGSEVLSEKQMLDEYVMLALRSKGLNTKDFKLMFGEGWITDNYNYFKKLERSGLLKLDAGIISFTMKGYALCDEILAELK